MTMLTISLPDDVKALAEAEAARSGRSLDEYLARLILAHADQPIDPALEAELLKALDAPGREYFPATWASKKQRFEERHAGGT